MFSTLVRKSKRNSDSHSPTRKNQGILPHIASPEPTLQQGLGPQDVGSAERAPQNESPMLPAIRLSNSPAPAAEPPRESSPIPFNYSEPIANDSDLAKRVRRQRQVRATVRERLLSKDQQILYIVIDAWYSVRNFKALKEDRFNQVRQILDSWQAADISEYFAVWWELSKVRMKQRKKLGKFVSWFSNRSIAGCWCRWQVLWAGCTDCRPIRKSELRAEDFQKTRVSKEQLLKQLTTEKGRAMMRVVSEADSMELFMEAVRVQMLDLETLGDVSLEELTDLDGPNLPLPKAQAVLYRTGILLKPSYARLRYVLQENENTAFAMKSYLKFVDEFRALINQGIHPLGKTHHQLRLEGQLEAQLEEEERIKKMKEEAGTLAPDQLEIDVRVKLADGSAVNHTWHETQDDHMEKDWIRGYMLDFPERTVGDIYICFVDVELVLFPESTALCYIIDPAHLHPQDRFVRRSNLVRGEGLISQKYRFHLDWDVRAGMYVMIQVASKSRPCKYTYCKDYKEKRTVNPLLSVSSVMANKKLNFEASSINLCMWMVIRRRRGQEVMDADFKAQEVDASVALLKRVRSQGVWDAESDDDELNEDEYYPEEDHYEEHSPIQKQAKVVRFDGRIGDVQLQRDHKFIMEKGLVETGVIGQTEKRPLALVGQYAGKRDYAKDMRMDVTAQTCCCFNPSFGEFWILDKFPSTRMNCLGADGQIIRSFDFRYSPSYIYADGNGFIYASDSHSIYKLTHDRFVEPKTKASVDRVTRTWIIRYEKPKSNSFPVGICVNAKVKNILYIGYSKGPIVTMDSQAGTRTGEIRLHPPIDFMSSLVCAADVFGIADAHSVKIYNLNGQCIHILGDCYNEPIVLWTGLDIYVADRNSKIWECFSARQAKGIEKCKQVDRISWFERKWTETTSARASTPGTKQRLKLTKKELSERSNIAGRPLSRALGRSRKLAFSQGLIYFDKDDEKYKPGRFFTEKDGDIRDEISEIKTNNPLMPSDPGNLWRAF